MKVKFLGSLLLISSYFSCFYSWADSDLPSYKLEVVRNGVTHRQVVINYWQGEYPSPVIDIFSSQPSLTSLIQGFTSLRVLDQRTACTVKNGIYHPWSETEHSVVNYYTVLGIEDYAITEVLPADIQDHFYLEPGDSMRVGDRILNVAYASEGMSIGTLVRNGQPDSLIQFSSEVFAGFPSYFKILERTHSLSEYIAEDGSTFYLEEQWLHVNCLEGHSVFVEVRDLLSQPGIKEGTIAGWGSVGPAEDLVP